jgi:Fur family ferric uptake transcriptional regulator
MKKGAAVRKEIEILDKFIKSKGLRYTPQREKILSVFLSVERHVSLDELYKLVKKKFRDIGYTTVYRTMRLLSESGLCRQIDFGDGISRFEHHYNHRHHDHLVCVKCDRLIEVLDPAIEKMQERMAKAHGFNATAHRLEIFGICRQCLTYEKNSDSRFTQRR